MNKSETLYRLVGWELLAIPRPTMKSTTDAEVYDVEYLKYKAEQEKYFTQFAKFFACDQYDADLVAKIRRQLEDEMTAEFDKIMRDAGRAVLEDMRSMVESAKRQIVKIVLSYVAVYSNIYVPDNGLLKMWSEIDEVKNRVMLTDAVQKSIHHGRLCILDAIDSHCKAIASEVEQVYMHNRAIGEKLRESILCGLQDGSEVIVGDILTLEPDGDFVVACEVPPSRIKRANDLLLCGLRFARGEAEEN